MRLKLGVPLPDSLFKAFGIAGTRSGYSPELAESVQPVVIVDQNTLGAAAGAPQHVSGDESTIATQAFVGFHSRGAGGAGTFTRLQLAMGFTNAGVQVVSNRTLLLDKVTIFAGIAQGVVLGFDASGAGGLQAFGGNGPWSKRNQALGAVTSSAIMRQGSPATLLANRSLMVDIPANALNFVLEFREPFLLQDGEIFSVSAQTVANADLQATFEWREVPFIA